MAAPRAMPPVLGVNIARRIGAGPQGVTSALENQRAEVDEEDAGDYERNEERRNPSGSRHELIPEVSLHFP